MTNKTVTMPLELAEDFASYAESGKVAEPQMVEQLRALLAAPAVEAAKCGVCGQGAWACNEGGCHYLESGNEAPAVERQEPVGRVSYIGNGFVRVRTSECLAMEQPLYTSPPAPVAVVLPSREAMRDIIAEAIGGDTYDCTRVWSAWGIGTMSEDDFVPITLDEERLYEIADACLDKVKDLNK